MWILSVWDILYSMNFECIKKTQLVTLKKRKNLMMGQKWQYIHVGGFAALRNKLQVQHTNGIRSSGRSTSVTGTEEAAVV